MKIILSKHIIQDKIPLFRSRGIIITQDQIIDVIKNPEHIDKDSDAPKIVVSTEFDENHVLRVVYKIEDDISIACDSSTFGV